MRKNFIQLTLISSFSSNFFIFNNANSENIEKKNLSFVDPRLVVLQPIKIHNITAPHTLLFMHFAKSGGTNISHLFEVISFLKALKTERAAVPRKNGISPTLATLDEKYEGGLAAIRANKYRFSDANLISGHIPFPQMDDQYVPNNVRQGAFIAIFRDPIEQQISAANFDFQRGYVDFNLFYNYFMLKMIDNYHTRMVAGQMSGECTEQTLQLAKDNIEKYFLFVAPFEQLETVMRVILSMYDMGPIANCRTQVTGVKAIVEIDDDTRTQLEFKHRYDIALYQFVQAKWQEFEKNHIDRSENASTSLNHSDSVIVIPPDFIHTRKFKVQTLDKINAHNAECTGELQKMSQAHSGLNTAHGRS